MESLQNTIAIQDYLPHRKPMLMVDLILELNDHEVKTVFEIKEDNLFVENGFFAESGLIENAAQTCSSIVGQTFFLDENQNVKQDVQVIGFISGIKKATILALPKVGQTINTEAVLHSRFDTENYSICTMKCKTFHETELLLEAEINLFIQEN
ncbi:ABC transporter permease [Flavobacterium sp. SM15]|uniref:ABC transporter permease n=1 Tax=Flavobacterium sp. SM15 TaxID=2908005 RepID=UPI001EDA0572|nr:ABC transporter permease [Flavobacterium sp. SM15]MCG2610968.1 ABC transporter permease [Flavobacterium sp. SM15]